MKKRVSFFNRLKNKFQIGYVENNVVKTIDGSIKLEETESLIDQPYFDGNKNGILYKNKAVKNV